MTTTVVKSHTTEKDAQIVQLFSVLGDPTRYQLVRILMEQQDICVSELGTQVGISTPGVSQQLKHLELAGIVKRQRKGQKICYRLNLEDAAVAQVLQFITAY